jgi:mannose-6-phosphate isomerase
MTTTIKPWGRELLWAETSAYAAKCIHIARGQRMSLQYHRVKVETVYVVEGRLLLTLDAATVVLLPGQSAHIPAGTTHRMAAPADQDVIVMEVSTPHLDDVVRLQDDYGRAPGDAPVNNGQPAPSTAAPSSCAS